MASHDDVEQALLDAIEKTATAGGNLKNRAGAEMVREAAVAYRALIGGAQPGSVVVKSS